MAHPDTIYKVATAALASAAEAAGNFPQMPIDRKDGYIHFSTAAQLRETLKLHFAGESDLMLLAVRTADLPAGLRWEPSRRGQLFPHYYGPLPWSIVASAAEITVDSDGNAALPAWVA
ncbi:MAG: DUF952 domain-containing protein [Devosia sp.]